MPRTGRPRVLDDAKRRDVCALVGAGCGLDAAARYVGCSVSTLRREALRNEEFRRQLRGAEVQIQLSPLNALRQAAGTHWRAAAWLLERLQPERFGARRSSTCSPKDLLEVVDAVLESAVEEIANPDERDRVCRRLEAAAYRSTRSLTAAQHARLDPSAGPFDPLKSAEDRGVDQLLAELENSRRDAFRNVARGNQKSQKSA
jgi:hypothetical protein